MNQEKEKKYLLHLKNGTIHLTHATCPHVKKMNADNKNFLTNMMKLFIFLKEIKKGILVGLATQIGKNNRRKLE